MSLRERFEAKVSKTDSCWLWTANRHRDGYGFIKDGVRNRQAHRVAHELYVGPIPDGMCVLHRCDTPACVNPDHLWLGTHADNHRDRNEKGRQAKGETHGRAKLAAADVVAIRNDARPLAAVAAQYSVALSQISMIRTGRQWRHLCL